MSLFRLTILACLMTVVARVAMAEFGFVDVQNMAKDLADSPHQPPTKVGDEFLKLDYDSHRKIAPRNDTALWRDQNLSTWVEFFSAGFLFEYGVDIYAVEQGEPKKIEYGTHWLQFRGETKQLENAPGGAFAGLRLLSLLPGNEHKTEYLTFLGASYFRGVGTGQWYGASARGLAIDIGLPKPEEFPRFTHLWVEQPGNCKDCRQRVWAILESPGIAGAYEFRIAPGTSTSVCVEAHLWQRHGIQKLALAPITSMWMWDAESQPKTDHRPEVHDSDGLLIHHGNDEWIWRKLKRPETPQTERWRVEQLKGFGLLQRERDPNRYRDDEAKYHLRPNVWVSTGVESDWGPGWIELLELPAAHEGIDNIGAYFVVDQDQTSIDEGFVVKYELTFGTEPPAEHYVADVIESRLDVDGAVRVVFAADRFDASLLPDEYSADIECSCGECKSVELRPMDDGRLVVTATYLPPSQPREQHAEVRIGLKQGKRLVSETTSLQWHALSASGLLVDSPTTNYIESESNSRNREAIDQ